MGLFSDLASDRYNTFFLASFSCRYSPIRGTASFYKKNSATLFIWLLLGLEGIKGKNGKGAMDMMFPGSVWKII